VVVEPDKYTQPQSGTLKFDQYVRKSTQLEMAATLSLRVPTSPSKKAAAFEACSSDIIDDRKRSVSPDSLLSDEVDNLDELRKKFVGEVDLPEC